MGRSGLPTTLVICCPLPAGMPQATAEAFVDGRRLSGMPVTFITAAERLPLIADRHGTTAAAHGIALEIPANQSRQDLRRLLARAAAAAPGLDAAAIRGPLPEEHRRVLADGGIRVVCRDRFEDAPRGSRRPAPLGWPCRSTLWGLWEVVHTAATPPGLLSGLLPWTARPASGSLLVIDVGEQGPHGDADSIRGRIEQWGAWAARRHAPGQVAFATLSDLPTLIAGGGRLPVGGSVLKAA